MLYAWIKIIHVISAAVLYGTGMGTAVYMFCVNKQKDICLIANATKQVVFVDWVFTGSSATIQFFSGMTLIYLKGYSFASLWIIGSMSGYVIAGACWIPVVYLQICCRNLAFDALKNNTALPKKYFRYYKLWWILGIPAFLSLMVVFYLMVNKPV
ncbi:MAG: hypothetical protein A3E82_01420 [Gammaproteobacteria bacterium RIFCSPHIGHO2_12_FULL_38_11]|nr:MAG: hypothetical protein A3E82_01420 [Gammaproteobacteria bacterium RIFCSPHIGHO2_12_FULL_38_11]